MLGLRVFSVAGFVALVVAAYAFSGPRGAAAVVVGTTATAVSMLGTWLGVRWVARIMQDNAPKWQSSAAPIAAMVIKLPVLLAAMSWALRLGPPAPAWFLGGLALVYSATVWWAVLRQKSPPCGIP